MNPLFKHRLYKVGKNLLLYLVMIASIALLVWLSILIPPIWITIPSFILIGLFVLGGLYVFIDWLFIEPFRKGKGL